MYLALKGSVNISFFLLAFYWAYKTNFMSGDPKDNVALYMYKFSLALAKAREPSLCNYILNHFKYINCVE